MSLRFDANMADASVSPMHQSTPQGCYRRKSQGQKRRGGERLQRQINLSGERVDNQDCSFSRFSEIATKIQVYGDDSALHSQSDLDPANSTRRQAEQNERLQEKRSNNPPPSNKYKLILRKINLTGMRRSHSIQHLATYMAGEKFIFKA